eukprot:4899886-Amphidinium_carterae.1
MQGRCDLLKSPCRDAIQDNRKSSALGFSRLLNDMHCYTCKVIRADELLSWAKMCEWASCQDLQCGSFFL